MADTIIDGTGEELAGAEYEAVSVDFKANAQRAPEYLAINPKGRVPSLVTSDGILTETPGDPRLHRPDLSEGAACADGPAVCLRAGAGLQ
jgi:hypothetical protein